MNTLSERLRSSRIIVDGGLGTMLQSRGLKGGEAPEEWSITHPDILIDIHKQYADAGCDIITANTFGVNSDKYQNYKSMLTAAIECAKKAVADYENRFIAMDIGPTGRLMAPLGDMEFEEAVSIFSNNISLAEELGADLIIIETMNDCQETKAAVIAAKESCSLPIFVCNAYDTTGRLMTGADPEAMIAMLEGLKVDAIGLNCSFGPDIALRLIDEFIDNSSTPLIVMPNAGLPKTDGEKTFYDVSCDEFSDCMAVLAQKGVRILGGCCGTTPEYMKKTIEKTKNLPIYPIKKKKHTVVSSYAKAVRVDTQPVLIGERINPTGKPKLKEALRSGNMGYILNEAVSQTQAGAHILDINVGLPDIDEADMLYKAATAVQAVTDLPLQLDTANPSALECSMRVYAGKPMINSVNGDPKSMDSVFPLVRKYGGVVIALTMNKNGIPDTANGRLKIAEEIAEYAKKYGIGKCDLIVDPLCLTISSNPDSALVTLESVKLLTEAGFKTSLGISNISFGLPDREKINIAFFAAALEKGLSCAIMNPHSKGMMDVYYAYRALHKLDPACRDYISYSSGNDNSINRTSNETELTLNKAILKGLKSDAQRLCIELLKTVSPMDVINFHIIPALNDIGEQFERRAVYLPQLLMSADAASASFAEVKAVIPKGTEGSGNSVILATVKGDIHDIGKNIVRVMLESYGFNVYDLGRDVDPEIVLTCVKETGCKLVGLSALMTTTVPSMEATIKLLKSFDPNIVTIVGGAVLNQEYSDMIGADIYAKDAMDTVRAAQTFYNLK